MGWGVISRMGYVALHSRDIAASVDHATDVLGLQSTSSTGTTVSLASTTGSAELLYADAGSDGVDRIGLVAANADALDAVHRRVGERGLVIESREPSRQDIVDAFTFVGPEGFRFEVYREAPASPLRRSPIAPERFGHVNLHPQHIAAMRDFFVDILDFRVSDVIGDGKAYFLRCNSEHHGVALIHGDGRFHHHAWQVKSLAELGAVGDRLFERGERLLMGPVRHGAGHNMAAYYVEPNGAVVELYADMEMIYDDDRPPIHWPADDRAWATRWSVYDFTEFRSHGVRPSAEMIR